MSFKLADTPQVREGPRLGSERAANTNPRPNNTYTIYSMRSAPEHGTIVVFDENQKPHWATSHRGAWHKVVGTRDFVTGETRPAMTGDIIYQPRGWNPGKR
jgi:hypothetical protein